MLIGGVLALHWTALALAVGGAHGVPAAHARPEVNPQETLTQDAFLVPDTDLRFRIPIGLELRHSQTYPADSGRQGGLLGFVGKARFLHIAAYATAAKPIAELVAEYWRDFAGVAATDPPQRRVVDGRDVYRIVLRETDSSEEITVAVCLVTFHRSRVVAIASGSAGSVEENENAALAVLRQVIKE